MLGDNIRAIRESKKIGLNEAAKKASISGSYLSDIERNKKKNVGMEALQKIADALGVDVNEFFDSASFEENSDIYNTSLSVSAQTEQPKTSAPSLTIKEQFKLEQQAEDIVSEFAISLAKEKEYLEDEDYRVLQASINSALQTIKLKNKEKYNPYKNK